VHSDIYKEGEALPEDLRGRTQDLAKMLATGDEIASLVRARVMQETKVEPESVRLDTVTREGLAFVFAEAFGRKAPDYAVQRAHEACLDAGITSVASLRGKLRDKSFREAVSKAYREAFRFGFEISAEDIFALAPEAVARGDKAAAKIARKRGKDERDDIERVWRGEVLRGLPKSWRGFLEALESKTVDVEEVADALGVARECSLCGTTIIDDFSFFEAIANYYGVDAAYEGDLIGTLRDCADCWADDNHPNLCSYHAYKASKDE
jgi:hypothetical protein